MDVKDAQTMDDVKHLLSGHFKEDTDFKVLMIAQFERMEPMVKAFENKKIVRMALNEETKTIVFWVKSVGSIALAITSLWAFIKYIVIRLLI